jgi:hypothetical protein
VADTPLQWHALPGQDNKYNARCPYCAKEIAIASYYDGTGLTREELSQYEQDQVPVSGYRRRLTSGFSWNETQGLFLRKGTPRTHYGARGRDVIREDELFIDFTPAGHSHQPPREVRRSDGQVRTDHWIDLPRDGRAYRVRCPGTRRPCNAILLVGVPTRR